MDYDVRQAIMDLIAKNKMTINSIANGDKALQRKLQRQINEGAVLTIDTIQLLKKTFPSINCESLITGEQKNQENNVLNTDGIPYFTEEFDCGSEHGFKNYLEQGKADGLMSIPGLKKVDGMFLVQARGRSMINRAYPSQSIPDGAWVALQRASIRSIQWGEVYALATADGFIIKKLMPSEREGCVSCVSYNTEEGFPPFDLLHDDIKDYARVKGVFIYSVWA